MLKLALILLLTASAVGAQDNLYEDSTLKASYERSGHHVVWAQEQITNTSALSDYRGTVIGEFCFYYPTPVPLFGDHICRHRPLSDSAILCQPYFDLAIPDDIKNSVLWMFCDSIKYMVWADVDSDSITKLHTDIVYFTYYGAMTVEYRKKLKRFSETFYNTFGRDGKPVYPVEYVTLDWHAPFAVLWERKVMWKSQ